MDMGMIVQILKTPEISKEKKARELRAEIDLRNKQVEQLEKWLDMVTD